METEIKLEKLFGTRLLSLNAVCRQLLTKQDDDNDDDICDYHRKKIEKLGIKSEKERQLYSSDDKVTLNRISNWSKALQHH